MIFKSESVLRPEYIPERLPFREDHLRRLIMYFEEFIRNPGSIYPKVILIGKPGTGKTVTARKFGEYVQFTDSSKLKRLKYVHVNCFINRTLFSVLKDIGTQLGLPIPRRGFSSDEMLELLLDMIRDRDIYSIVTLDDVFHLTNHSGADALGKLVKLSEEYLSRGDRYRFGLILISQNLSFIDQLDRSSRSSLGSAIIEFQPYSKDQIFEILLDRAREALHEHAYSEEILEMIADVAGADVNLTEEHRGDARYAIDILWRAAKLAEMNGSSRILPEHVREAIKSTLRGIRVEELKLLPTHEKLFLLAIIKMLKRKEYSPYITFGEAEEMYQMLCEEYNETPRKHTQLWEYLKDLKDKGIVETRISSKGMRGRTTLISIPSEPLNILEQEVEDIVKRELAI